MDIFKLFGTIAINNENANHSIDETTDKAEKAHPKIKAAFDKIGSAAIKVGKVIGTGLAAGSVAMAKLVKDSVAEYSNYEQLVGGVETLFASSSEAVMKYADNAYKTAGMSANEYMETVTSFSASLLQGLGGDTDKAAEVANRAITDMSDNANKMGTDISMIQNAYQGFAKQNYTMLDNLKLGYGGTASEMARLINDSGVLGDAITVTADTVNSVSFDKIIAAVAVVQDRMGITGTTAKEASSTIQGSISSMRSAWRNFITGMADDSQEFDALLGNLVDSMITVADNIIPRLQMLLPRLVEGLNQLITTLLPYIPGLIEALLPGVINGALALITGLVTALPQILQILIAQIPNILTQIGTALINAFPVLLQTVKNLFGQIWDYIAVELLGTKTNFETVFADIKVVFEGLWTALKTAWESIGQPIWDLIKDCIEIVESVFAERMPAIREFVSNCFSDIKAFWENNLKPCFDAIKNFLEKVLAPVFKFVFETTIGPAVDAVFRFIRDLWIYTLKPVFTGITDFLTGIFTLNFSKAFEGLVKIVKGIWDGIINVVKTPINFVIGIINKFLGGLNKIKVPDWVPLIGGKGINIPLIPLLEKGGILEKGQVGLLEGSGAEAVVPLDQNRAWINAVARDMEATGITGGNSQQAQRIIELLEKLLDMLPDTMTDAFASMRFDVNNREFARMVKAVN